ncbi:hypothetical protein [Streptomyces sp. WM6378]|uniref:hypothetical protein n=1 Tax=Streptomyces sp. WM6378 TaxID=1415557 RepID=UPI000B3304FA|nr:hypothetical protein [Streptomyces sp. WM6378]
MFGTLPVILAGILRMASRHDHPGYLAWAWGLQGIALCFIVAGFIIGAVKNEKPSPGIWGVLAIWVVCAIFGLTYSTS